TTSIPGFFEWLSATSAVMKVCRGEVSSVAACVPLESVGASAVLHPMAMLYPDCSMMISISEPCEIRL
ncbi:MAG: hypothetical protein MI684_06180, partial [Chlorobiales bacterium]|nr:hypothetical protein [Chlorobiales bacterium]